MKDRLLKFLQEENLSAARFADEIGVQRSSISHILSGRNNPGYEFIQKILKKYPHMNAEWLILGNGNMLKSPKQASLFEISAESNAEPEPEKEISTINDSFKSEKKAEINTDKVPEVIVSLAAENAKITTQIEKVVILYNDRTFREYLPGK